MSNFIRKCANYAVGSSWDELIDEKADYMVLDLAEERIPKMKIEISENEQIFIPNHCYYENMVKDFKQQYQCNEYRFCNHPWDKLKKNYEVLCGKLIDRYEDSIIIIEVYMCKEFLDKDYRLVEFNEKNSGFSQKYIADVNLYLNRLYGLLENFLPQAKVIRIPSNNFGVYYHKWGINPLHYTEETYVYLVSADQV